MEVLLKIHRSYFKDPEAIFLNIPMTYVLRSRDCIFEDPVAVLLKIQRPYFKNSEAVFLKIQRRYFFIDANAVIKEVFLRMQRPYF